MLLYYKAYQVVIFHIELSLVLSINPGNPFGQREVEIFIVLRGGVNAAFLCLLYLRGT